MAAGRKLDLAPASTGIDARGRGIAVRAVRGGVLAPGARAESQLSLAWRRLRQDSFAIAGGIIVLLTLFLALAAPLVSPHDPLAQDSSIRLSPIGTAGFPLGTDGNGRDILSRLIYGSRTALLVATIPVVVAAAIGLLAGLVAGYRGGWVDAAVMRVADVLFAFPAILLAIAIVAALGPRLVNAMMALAIVFIPAFARLVRASVLSLRQRDFVLAAEASGASAGTILGRHIYAAFTFQIPLATRKPGDRHELGVAYDREEGTVRWLVDGKERFRVDRIGHRIDRKYLTIDHGGDEVDVEPKQLNFGLGLFTLLDGRLPSGKALVQLSNAPGFYFDPSSGEPSPQTFVDEQSEEGSRLFGQGVELRVERFAIESRRARHHH